MKLNITRSGKDNAYGHELLTEISEAFELTDNELTAVCGGDDRDRGHHEDRPRDWDDYYWWYRHHHYNHDYDWWWHHIHHHW